jgi:cysteine desulfurase
LNSIYLDHNATTRMRPEVRAELLSALEAVRGNPSSLHASGRAARHVLDLARERVAAALSVTEEEIVFTSGGTEANNLALLGAARAWTVPGLVVTTEIEHSSVLGPARRLEQEGHALLVLGVDREGAPDLERLHAEVRRARPGVVSVSSANNEVGTCPDLSGRLGGAVPEGVLLHTDAVQALGRLPLALCTCGVDLASFSAHKLGGPVGVGVLYRRRGVPLEPLAYGGGQEDGLRPGTENVVAISAAALAVELAVREQVEFAARARELARILWEGARAAGLQLELVGPPLESARLPGTLNVVAPNVEGKVLVTRLDLGGLEVSAGSACASGSLEPSHVLLAMGYDHERARAGLRITIGRDTTLADVRNAVDILRRTLR